MEGPTPERLLQIGTGFWASKVLLSAVELELFTVLAERPETLAGISSRIGLHPRSARDFLDALVALNCLERRDGHYANTPSTELFLDKNKPDLHRRHAGDGQRPSLPASGAISPPRFAPANLRTRRATAAMIPSRSSTRIPIACATSSAP